ncbi:membrane hypothetical protein [Gammaproteobacteria bacterium]
MKILIWDWPIRIFHWLLAGCLVVAWVTAESDRLLDWHVFAGSLMLVLLGFRLMWGALGSRHARFSAFPFRPVLAWNYVRRVLTGRTDRHLGHNPAGSLAIYLMLLLIGLVCGSGLLVLGVEEGHGPLASLFNPKAGDWVREGHEMLTNLLLITVAIHVVGVIVASWLHRENLVVAMLDGRKSGPPEQAIPSARPWVAVGLGLVLLAYTGWYFSGYTRLAPDKSAVPWMGSLLEDKRLAPFAGRR